MTASTDIVDVQQLLRDVTTAFTESEYRKLDMACSRLSKYLRENDDVVVHVSNHKLTVLLIMGMHYGQAHADTEWAKRWIWCHKNEGHDAVRSQNT